MIPRTNCRQKIFRRTTRPAYYWDLRILGDYWNCFGASRRVYHHTISATLVYGLRTGLMQLAEEGLQASWTRHAAAAVRFRKGLQDLGLQCFVEDPRYQLSTVTSIKLPLNIDSNILIARAMEKWDYYRLIIAFSPREFSGCNLFFFRYKVEISHGLGPTVGKLLRVGLMGVNARTYIVDRVLTALNDGLQYAKINAPQRELNVIIDNCVKRECEHWCEVVPCNFGDCKVLSTICLTATAIIVIIIMIGI